jgi:ASC-1-like (ASCH) protein
MGLRPEPFEKIKEGTKTIELRLWDEKRRKINVGDIIEFTDTEDASSKIKVTVKSLNKAGSFSELLDRFPIESFGGENKEQLLDRLRDYYSEQEEKELGVVGIEIALI